jgi:hypothetical protein
MGMDSSTAGLCTLKMDGMEKILVGLANLKQVRSMCIRWFDRYVSEVTAWVTFGPGVRHQSAHFFTNCTWHSDCT